MRQKTKNDRNHGSNAKKIFFCLVPKFPTQMGSLSAKNNASKKFSRLGTFKLLTNSEKPHRNLLFNYSKLSAIG